MKTVSALSIAALALAACQQPAEKGDASSVDAIESRVRTLVDAVPDCQGWAGAEPRGVHTVDLDSATVAVVADCSVSEGQSSPMRKLYVQGPDGVLKQQMLLIYNGPGYESDYTWEAVEAAPIAIDPSTHDVELEWKAAERKGQEGFDDADATRSVVTWRWDRDHFAMVSSTFEAGTPLRQTGAWPTTPPTDDPTGAPFDITQPR